jgi:uncharacterized protein with PIN domain
MNRASFRFYAELNDFLPPGRRHIPFEHAFNGNPAIKDTIEALGVPHTEIDLILVNGESVDFSRPLQAGDRISVYPIFESIDITPVLRVRPKPLRIPRFVLDTHLGRLAAYLRMLGFDALYRNDFNDDLLAELSQNENRILLTRDRGLLKRSMVTHGYWMRETSPRLQLMEVLQRFDLIGSIIPFKRCMRCNGLLEEVSKEEVLDQLAPETRRYYEKFKRCQACSQIYWRGSHYTRMQKFIDQLLRDSRGVDLEGKA